MARLRFELCVLFLALSTTSAGKVHKHRNALILFADDGGFMQTAYNNTVCDTPNLDKLASRSVTFTKGYTSVSSCSPSRSVVLTGLPVHQNGMYGIQNGVHHFNSFDEVKSLPVILSENGVYTGLIGKKHVAPASVYKFDFQKANNQQDGRNITHIKHDVLSFLHKARKAKKPFFLYMAFYDPHRGSPNTWKKYGPFMNKWGTGQPGMRLIPDWKPKVYDPKDVIVPFFLPDTKTVREEIAAMYTTFNRMDQGIGLILDVLKTEGYLDDTLIIWSSDNGIPFPAAKTNLYEPGSGEPMMVSSPLKEHRRNWGKFSDAPASTMDFVPTVLNWFRIEYPKYQLLGMQPKLTGNNLLDIAGNPRDPKFTHVFSSHIWHGITMDYPMRVIRTKRHRLIHNMNWRSPYPLGTDIYASYTYREIINKTARGEPTGWYKSLHQYYYRPEWELFDVDNDPKELNNLAYDPNHKDLFNQLNNTLTKWMLETNDPWRCSPDGVWIQKFNRCFSLENKLKGEATLR